MYWMGLKYLLRFLFMLNSEPNLNFGQNTESLRTLLYLLYINVFPYCFFIIIHTITFINYTINSISHLYLIVTNKYTYNFFLCNCFKHTTELVPHNMVLVYTHFRNKIYEQYYIYSTNNIIHFIAVSMYYICRNVHWNNVFIWFIGRLRTTYGGLGGKVKPYIYAYVYWQLNTQVEIPLVRTRSMTAASTSHHTVNDGSNMSLWDDDVLTDYVIPHEVIDLYQHLLILLLHCTVFFVGC